MSDRFGSLQHPKNPPAVADAIGDHQTATPPAAVTIAAKKVLVQATLDGWFGSRRPQEPSSAAAKPKRVTSGRKSDVSRHEPESAGEVSSDDDAPLVHRSKRSRYVDDEAEEVSDEDDADGDSFVCSDHNSVVSDDTLSSGDDARTQLRAVIRGMRNRGRFMMVADCPHCALFIRYMGKFVQRVADKFTV